MWPRHEKRRILLRVSPDLSNALKYSSQEILERVFRRRPESGTREEGDGKCRHSYLLSFTEEYHISDLDILGLNCLESGPLINLIAPTILDSAPHDPYFRLICRTASLQVI